MYDTVIHNIYYLTFALLLVLVLGGGILAVTAQNLIYCFFGLVASLLGVAGLYYNLGSPLVAVMQVMIYIGAVCVAIAFGVSLTRKAGQEGVNPPDIKAAHSQLSWSLPCWVPPSRAWRDGISWPQPTRSTESRIGWMPAQKNTLFSL